MTSAAEGSSSDTGFLDYSALIPVYYGSSFPNGADSLVESPNVPGVPTTEGVSYRIDR